MSMNRIGTLMIFILIWGCATPLVIKSGTYYNDAFQFKTDLSYAKRNGWQAYSDLPDKLEKDYSRQEMRHIQLVMVNRRNSDHMVFSAYHASTNILNISRSQAKTKIVNLMLSKTGSKDFCTDGQSQAFPIENSLGFNHVFSNQCEKKAARINERMYVFPNFKTGDTWIHIKWTSTRPEIDAEGFQLFQHLCESIEKSTLAESKAGVQ
jgi:hypothetical protein